MYVRKSAIVGAMPNGSNVLIVLIFNPPTPGDVDAVDVLIAFYTSSREITITSSSSPK